MLVERLERKSIDLNTRSAALDKLAALHKTDRVSEAIAALGGSILTKARRRHQRCRLCSSPPPIRTTLPKSART